jgi:glutamate-1-semialdehyde 2,1-aminomutase
VTRSDELFARACRVIPGGVHSPVRSLKSVDSTPLFIESAHGARLTDVDGNDYIDFCMAFGPLILGHGQPTVKAAVTGALEKGWSFGTAETGSLELAEFITDRLEWVDAVRFVNSGTEAVMSALRLARAATGRDKVLKFDGCYHGHADSMLLSAGSGLADRVVSDSAGIPAGVAGDTLSIPLDDEAVLDSVFAQHGDSLAAVIIEPVPANNGLLPQRTEFLTRLAALCESHGALLIFDEVITGFRLAFGGFAEQSGLRPDIVTWGKIIGGGFPVGAIAARRDLMQQFAPVGPVYQAGTLSANPVAMAAGLATLSLLADGDAYTTLERLGAHLETALANIPGLAIQRCGSVFWLVATDAADGNIIRAKSKIPAAASSRYTALFHNALEAGLYLPPSPCEVGFLSTAHTPSDIDRLAETVRGAFD